jgi:hypothetical protein
MKSTSSIMTTTWKKLFILPLLLATLATPLCAQTDDSTNNGTNTVAPAQPMAQTPPITPDQYYANQRQIRPDDMVNIIAIIGVFGGGVAVCALFFYFRHRRHQILHETLRTMIDKGVPIPPELLAAPQQNAPPRIRNDLLIGLVLVAMGFGLSMFIYGPARKFGFIPLFIGVAFLIAWKVEQKKKGQPDK